MPSKAPSSAPSTTAFLSSRTHRRFLRSGSSSTFCWFGPCGQSPTGAQLFTIKPNGEGLRKLTHLPGNSYNAGWSPSGKEIVFAHHRALGPEGDIYTINADGSGVRRLTHKPKLDAHRPDWGRGSPSP